MCSYKKMKRSWFSIIIFVGLIGLLVVLAVVQYRWQTVASEADREKIQVRVNADVHRFADDFNREIQSAFMAFQIDLPIDNVQFASNFNDRLAAWKENAEDSDLISGFYYFPASSDKTPYRYDLGSGKFELQNLSTDLTSLREQIDKDLGDRFFFEKQNALVISINERAEPQRVVVRVQTPAQPMTSMPATKQERLGSLVLLLDKNVIDQKILPRLSEKYFEGNEFDVAVTDSEKRELFSTGKVVRPDATASIMDISPFNFTFFTKTVKGEAVEARKGAMVLGRRLETRTFKRTSGIEDIDGVNIKLGPTEDSVGDNSSWLLSVQHSAGSVDAFISGERNKNLAIGFGIYLLLIAGLSAIVLSAMRAKRLAQRQLDFVSSVSHEFRTPLAVIYSAGENLADGVAANGDQVERYGDLIKGEGKKLSVMVEQILHFAGARSGKQKYDLRSGSIAEIIENAVAECRPLAIEKNFAIEKEISKDLPLILTDSKALSSAIQNLVVNSIKYCNGHRWLKISATNGGGNIKIIVEDRGIGISKKDIAHIFEPFYRAKDVVDEQIHGNGLGLSLVKQIVEAHKGKINVESEIGKGTKFIIHLPKGI